MKKSNHVSFTPKNVVLPMGYNAFYWSHNQNTFKEVKAEYVWDKEDGIYVVKFSHDIPIMPIEQGDLFLFPNSNIQDTRSCQVFLVYPSYLVFEGYSQPHKDNLFSKCTGKIWETRRRLDDTWYQVAYGKRLY